MKVLIVDDSATIRRMHQNSLKVFEPVEVLQAQDGEEALAQLDSVGGVDLILTDLDIPRMNGLDFIRRVTSHERFGRIPVIVITASSEKMKVIEAIKAGARNFLVKPYSPEALRERVSQVLSSPREESGAGRSTQRGGKGSQEETP